MSGHKSLQCYNCGSVLLSLPTWEVEKFNGFNFVCDCCGHHNLLDGNVFSKACHRDQYYNVASIFDII